MIAPAPDVTAHRAVRPTPAASRSLDADAITAAAPVVVLLIVGTLRKGAFFSPDVVVLPCLCLALALVSPIVARRLATHRLPVLAGVGVTVWWVVDALIGGHPVESWRMPATWACAAAGYAIVRALPTGARRVVAGAVTMFGCGISVVGLALVAARSTMWTWPDERSLRFQGPLTYPSAIGLYLLLALVASLVVWPARDEPASTDKVATALRSLLVLGAVATDSRGALIAFVVLLCFRQVRRAIAPAVFAAAVGAPLLLYGQRDGVRPALIALAVLVAIALSMLPKTLLREQIRLAYGLVLPLVGIAGFLLATQHHTVSGLDASWTERAHILRGAFSLFGAHPLFGAGPDPTIPTTTLGGLPGVDAFAHNEPIELLLSIGVVGTVAFAVAAFLVVRSLWARRGELAVPVLSTAAAAGVVDFVWHFPALGLLAGVVAGIGRATR